MFATTTATSSCPMNAGIASRNAVAPSNTTTNRALRCNHHHQSRSNVKTRRSASSGVVSVQAEAQKTIDMNEVSIFVFYG